MVDNMPLSLLSSTCRSASRSCGRKGTRHDLDCHFDINSPGSALFGYFLGRLPKSYLSRGGGTPLYHLQTWGIILFPSPGERGVLRVIFLVFIPAFSANSANSANSISVPDSILPIASLQSSVRDHLLIFYFLSLRLCGLARNFCF